jgi:anti-sigma regulatory factor (Ser/Thr protein kinase)
MEPLTLPASLDSLSLLRQYVVDAAKAAGLNKEATYKLKLTVDEIATNIISYGYGESDLSGDITIEEEVIGNRLRITLADTGVEFDPRKRKLPDEDELSKPLEEREIGGLGIFLTMRDVDIFDYKRVDNRNYNIFEMYIKERT